MFDSGEYQTLDDIFYIDAEDDDTLETPLDKQEIQATTQSELDLEREKTEILAKLNECKTVEARVNVFATFVDTFGLDALIGLIPVLGDAAPTVIALPYLLFEANRLGLPLSSQLKIVLYHGLDIAIGTFTPPGGDLVTDYIFQANKLSAEEFQDFTDNIVQEAREKGLPESEIAAISNSVNNTRSITSIISNLKPKKSA